MSTVATPHEGPSTGEPAPAFQHKLGLFDAVMLVAGTMIGSAIFVVSAAIARDVGSAGWLMAIWILTGAMTIMGALSYAELAGMMPYAGGQYVFLREAYSPLWGFLYGWTCFLVIQTGSIAAVGVVFAKYLGVFWPELDTKLYHTPLDIEWSFRLPWMTEPLTFFKREAYTINCGHLVAAAVVIFLTLLNCRGLREGKWVQNLFTLTKTAALVVLIVVGLAVAANPDATAANRADLWAGIHQTKSYAEVVKLAPAAGLAALMVMGASMTGALFAADAWNNVTFTAGEVRDPHRTLPRSLALGTGLVIILYLLANLGYLAALPMQGSAEATAPFERGIAHAKDERVATAVMQIGSPGWGVSFMAAAIMISAFGCINGMSLMGARLYYAMARDGLFFQSVGRLNRRGVPAVALLLQGAWSVLLIFSGTYDELLDYIMFAALLFYVLTVVGLFILRRKRPDLDRPYRAFGYPVVPAIYVLLCAAIMLDLLIVRPVYTWPGLILVLAGIPVYFWWRLRVPRRKPDM